MIINKEANYCIMLTTVKSDSYLLIKDLKDIVKKLLLISTQSWSQNNYKK